MTVKVTNLQGSTAKRVDHDFYPTPRIATELLLKSESFGGITWEPACGDGAISTVFKDVCKMPIYSSDLEDRGYGDSGINFLTVDPPGIFQNIITNPPYSLAEEFVHRSIKVATQKVALLLKLNFIAGQKRKKTIYDTCPPQRIYVFSKRLNFDRGTDKAKTGGGLLEYAWFVWDKEYSKDETIVRWL